MYYFKAKPKIMELRSLNVFPQWKNSKSFYVNKIYMLENSEVDQTFRVDIGFVKPYSFFAFAIERKVDHRWTLNALPDVFW